MRSSSWITIDASSMSWCSNASSVRFSVVTTRSMPPSACVSRPWSSSLYCCRPGIRRSPSGSAEAAAHVVLGLLLARVGEDLLRRVNLDQAPGPARRLDVEERGHVARPRGLLHVVRDDDDRVLALELGD